jgi:hypothetical protein
MKYIVMDVKKPGGFHLEVPFVFPDMVVHHMMAQVCKALCEATWPETEVKPVSAGFVSSTAFEDECYGESETLGLKSRPEDSRLIQMCDYGAMHV